MDERKLRYFLAVVDNGSITAAATRLHIAQPSLSQALRAFERELGVELFHRTGRGLTISSAGQALVGPARQALRSLDVARAAVGKVRDVVGRSLEIAALSTLTVDPLADHVGRFRSAHPGVAVRLLGSETVSGVTDMVAEGTAELGLTYLPADNQALHVVPIGDHELFMVLPPDSDVPDGPMDAAAMSGLPFVLAPPGTSTRVLLEQRLAEANARPHVAVEAVARDSVVMLVVGGAGATLLPGALAYAAWRRGAILRRVAPPLTQRIGYVHRSGSLSPAASAFVTALEQLDLNAAPIWRYLGDEQPIPLGDEVRVSAARRS